MLPRVSIVVPVYNVERYLSRCVDSILAQTYSNLEVILVNDGSPDRCGAICEAYREKDPRIVVLHKQNGGLSDARNYGMRAVTGGYVSFVDSDDWLDPGMIDEMIREARAHDADVVQCSFYYAYDTQLQLDTRYSTGQRSTVISNPELMRELIRNERVKNFAWGKLYRTALIRDIPFKQGVLFEDVFWAHHVLHGECRFVYYDKPLYYYYQREDSIVARYTSRNLDFLRGLEERHRFIERHYASLASESYKQLLKHNLIHYNLLLANRRTDPRGELRKGIVRFVKDHAEPFKAAVKDDRTLHAQLKLFLVHPLASIGWLAANRLLRKLGITRRAPGLTSIRLQEAGSP